MEVKENISFPEASRRLSFVQPGTFAVAVRRGPTPTIGSLEVQIRPQDLDRSRKTPKPKKATHVLPLSKETQVASTVPKRTSAVVSPSQADEEVIEASSLCLGEHSSDQGSGN